MSGLQVEIRRASREDFPILVELITALAHYEKLDPPDAGAQQRLLNDGWCDQPRFEAWIATQGAEPAGYAIVFETYSTFLAQPTLYLEDIFVLPDRRSSGVGYALFKRLAKEAVDRGCGRMEWACLDWNELGLRFYDRLGARGLNDWKYFRLVRHELERLADPGDSR